MIVVFTRGRARVLRRFDLPAVIHRKDVVFVNPDLSRVKNIPPHFWTVERGQIVEMSSREKARLTKPVPTLLLGPSTDPSLYYALASVLAVLAVAACHAL